MKKRFFVALFCLCFVALCAATSRAQDASEADGAAGNSQGAGASGSPYELKKGTNEFGFWGGGAFSATTAFGGLRPSEASGRHYFTLALRYGRTLAANRHAALQYTLDAIPVAIAGGNITEAVQDPGGTFIATKRESTYGFGLTPLGLQADFSNTHRVKPFAHVNAGGILFSKRVPLPDAERFVFTLEGGGGVRVFTSERRAVSLGVRLTHISDANRSGSNRGLNQFVVYAGFSVFK